MPRREFPLVSTAIVVCSLRESCPDTPIGADSDGRSSSCITRPCSQSTHGCVADASSNALSLSYTPRRWQVTPLGTQAANVENVTSGAASSGSRLMMSENRARSFVPSASHDVDVLKYTLLPPLIAFRATSIATRFASDMPLSPNSATQFAGVASLDLSSAKNLAASALSAGSMRGSPLHFSDRRAPAMRIASHPPETGISPRRKTIVLARRFVRPV